MPNHDDLPPLTTRRFAFCGNRFFVLQEMQLARLNVVSLAAVSGSHLERELQHQGLAYTAVASKAEFLAWLAAAAFDVFLSNGCPHIIPATHLRRDRLFINVHPSCLPDLRGADPVPGALLTGRDAGATCHVMDAGIDTGDIISQVTIPHSDDLDAAFLYQLSFMAEREVFRAALARGFQPARPQVPHVSDISYSKKPADLVIDWNDTGVAIIRRVKAFSNPSQGARFTFDGGRYRCFDAEWVSNAFLLQRREQFAENEIALRFENMAVVRKGDGFVKLKCIEGDVSRLKVGGILRTDGDKSLHE